MCIHGRISPCLANSDFRFGPNPYIYSMNTPRLFLLSFSVLAVLFVPGFLPAQSSTPHRDHMMSLQAKGATSEKAHDAPLNLDPNYSRSLSKKCLPKKEVYGFHPAWSGSAYTDYDFPLLNTLSYFSYVIDPATGGASTTNQWLTSPLVDQAHEGGAKVELTAACFGSSEIATLLGNKGNTKKLRDSLVAMVLARDADGICLDFEGMNPAQRKPFVDFCTAMSDTLHRLPRVCSLSITLPALDPQNAFDLKSLAPVVDRFVLMAYDFHYTGSKTTGPVAPLDEVGSSIDRCLNGGIPGKKLLLGVPYYGYEWPCKSPVAGSTTTAKGSAVTLRNLANAVATDTAHLDATIPWWVSAAPFQQTWAEDAGSMQARFDMVEKKQIAGIGIWALGYDHGVNTYWDLIKKNFYDCSAETTSSPDQVSTATEIPGSGVTSAERNEYHWLWILGGGLAAILIMLVVRRLL